MQPSILKLFICLYILQQCQVSSSTLKVIATVAHLPYLNRQLSAKLFHNESCCGKENLKQPDLRDIRVCRHRDPLPVYSCFRRDHSHSRVYSPDPIFQLDTDFWKMQITVFMNIGTIWGNVVPRTTTTTNSLLQGFHHEDYENSVIYRGHVKS